MHGFEIGLRNMPIFHVFSNGGRQIPMRSGEPPTRWLFADRGELKIREFQHEYGKDEVLFLVKIAGREIDEQTKGGEGPCGGTRLIGTVVFQKTSAIDQTERKRHDWPTAEPCGIAPITGPRWLLPYALNKGGESGCRQY